jgi:hypothetical protein
VRVGFGGLLPSSGRSMLCECPEGPRAHTHAAGTWNPGLQSYSQKDSNLPTVIRSHGSANPGVGSMGTVMLSGRTVRVPYTTCRWVRRINTRCRVPGFFAVPGGQAFTSCSARQNALGGRRYGTYARRVSKAMF